ncbi:LPS-assembly protein LptD [Silvibacterium sp.]|uniref:LPS-assembly protein LptD n=1 Tax=Silvibacterium sp. TaxID=1964179 RepID=UPI0039E35392
MRVRTFLCTMLLLLCHSQLWSQALTKQFPLPGAALTPLSASTPATAISGSTDLPEDASVESQIPEAHVVPAPPQGTPVRIQADSQTYVKTDSGGVYTLIGHVVIHYKDYVISADRATYNQDSGEVVGTGHLHVDGGPDSAHLMADHGTVNPDAHTGHFYDVTGTLGLGHNPDDSQAKTVTKFVSGAGEVQQAKILLQSSSPFAVTGKELIETGERQYHVIDGSMTSCRLPNPDWRLIAHDFLLNNNVAKGANSWFELDGLPMVHRVPLFYLPYVTHPIDSDSRQSGFVIPSFGSDTTKGLILGEDYYQVLGRSADLTVGSQYYSKRGFAPRALFRYRGRDYDFATFRFVSLLDRLPGTENQGGVDMLFDGRRDFDSETRAVADLEYLSSYVYRQEFEDNYVVAINSEVKSQAFFAHSHNGLAESVAFNRYESYESSSSTTSGEEEIKIIHAPTLAFDGVDQYLPGTPLMWGVSSSGTGLSRSEPGFQTTHFIPRLDLEPHLAMPLHFSGWSLRPAIGVRDTFYGSSQNPAPVGVLPTERDSSVNRKDFEADVDLRAPALQRDFSSPLLAKVFGADIRHTIEPEVEYRYVGGIDNFNSILRFDPTDVASDTNELGYFLHQRIYLRPLKPKPCKGDEALGPDTMCNSTTNAWLNWEIGQKLYFNDDFGKAVTDRTRNVLESTLDLTGVAFLSHPRDYSPIISRLRMQTTSTTNVEWDMDYDTKAGRLDSSNLFGTYKQGDFSFTLADAHLHTLAGASAPEESKTASGTTTLTSTTSSNQEVDFNQLRLTAVYGSPIRPGLSLGMNTGYDFTLDRLQYGGIQASYNWDCCGLSFEVRRYSLGTVPEHTTYLYNFTLANVGTAGSLSWAERVF